MKKLTVSIVLAGLMALALISCATVGAGGTSAGGEDTSLAVLVPEGSGLSDAQNYLPSLVQGVLVDDFKRFSSISILDRQNLEKILRETESGIYTDKGGFDFVKLGEIAKTDYILSGTIIKTTSGYSLSVTITDSKTGLTKASYNGVCSVEEFDNYTGIKRASLDLMTEMGVRLSAQAKAELGTASSTRTRQAQEALAKGVTAERQGTVEEAMQYWFQALAFDPTLTEASSRISSTVSARLSSGGLGDDLRGRIQAYRDKVARHDAAMALRAQFMEVQAKLQREMQSYFDQHLPYEIIYDPKLREAGVDLARGTADFTFTLRIASTGAVEKTLAEMNSQLRKQYQPIKNLLPDEKRPADITVEIPRVFTVKAELLDENGRIIGQAEQKYDLLKEYPSEKMRFASVSADSITDELTIRISSVNGRPVNSAVADGYINIHTTSDLPASSRGYAFRMLTNYLSVNWRYGTADNRWLAFGGYADFIFLGGERMGLGFAFPLEVGLNLKRWEGDLFGDDVRFRNSCYFEVNPFFNCIFNTLTDGDDSYVLKGVDVGAGFSPFNMGFYNMYDEIPGDMGIEVGGGMSWISLSGLSPYVRVKLSVNTSADYDPAKLFSGHLIYTGRFLPDGYGQTFAFGVSWRTGGWTRNDE